MAAGPAARLGPGRTRRVAPRRGDAQVSRRFGLTRLGGLQGNPDFPLLLLVHRATTPPGAVLVALDARNGTDIWSLGTDPVVVIALFADPMTLTALYVDRGFVAQGLPSGRFQRLANPRAMLPDLLHVVSALPTRVFL